MCHCPLWSRDGQVALEILRGTHTDRKINTPVIILLDINMPRMNGFEFLEVLRADAKLRTTIIFMLTTSSADNDRAKAYSKNIAGYVTKDSVGEHFKHLFSLLDKYTSTTRLSP